MWNHEGDFDDDEPDGPWCLDCGPAWQRLLPDVRRFETSENALGVVPCVECRELLGSECYDRECKPED